MLLPNTLNILLAGSACDSVSQQLWQLLLQLQAGDSSLALASQAAATSDRLAAACGLGSSADLAAAHAPALITQLAHVTTPSQTVLVAPWLLAYQCFFQ